MNAGSPEKPRTIGAAGRLAPQAASTPAATLSALPASVIACFAAPYDAAVS
jgi:hypothetical protein